MDVVIPTWMVMFATHSLLLPLMWIWRSGYLGTKPSNPRDDQVADDLMF